MTKKHKNNVFTNEILRCYVGKRRFNQIMKQINNQTLYSNKELIREYASALKKWIIKNSIKYYCHYFVPISGVASGKQVSLQEYPNNVLHLDKFGYDDLICTEVDGSSFFSDGIASTESAKGIIVWDYNLQPFYLERGGVKVLYLPSVFISYDCSALDFKVPLYRAKRYFTEQFNDFCSYFKIDCSSVDIFTGFEQEYFLFSKDNNFNNCLLPSDKSVVNLHNINQKFMAHYFGKIDDSILRFMNRADEVLTKVGVMPKIRHKEVAPSQYEFVPVFDDCVTTCDKELITSQILNECAQNNGFNYVDFEKPFNGVNGSGKHLNWSIWVNKKLNLVDYGNSNQFYYWFMMAIILNAVKCYGDLLTLSIFSYGNEFRLGGHEAPPLKINLSIGEELENHLHNHDYSPLKGNDLKIDLKYASVLEKKDFCNRNRTSPFVYTGSKFEFRAVGSRSRIYFPCTVLYGILGWSCKNVMTTLSKNKCDLVKTLNEVIDNSIDIVKNGNNYEINKENSKNKEKNVKKHKKNDNFTQNSINICNLYKKFNSKKVVNFFEQTNILSEKEIKARANFFAVSYIENAKNDSTKLLEFMVRKNANRLNHKGQELKRLLGLLKSENKIYRKLKIASQIVQIIKSV